MRATFEEKTYENYFNIELSTQADIYFPLGQVQEGFLGFDASAFSKNRKIWRLLGWPFQFFPSFSGVDLRDIADEMERFLSFTIENIPKMKANLLFQYKKPDYITIALGSEWSHWKKPYYRYDIYREQQDLLMHIAASFGNRIFIVYASPAIHDVNELVTAHINRKIIEISNFRKASELNTHYRNTYIKAGTYSIACSEPEKLDNFDLIKTLIKINNDKDESVGSNKDFIINFRKQIVSLINEDQYYSTSFIKLNEAYMEFEKYGLFYSHLILSNFKLLTGVQWLVGL